MGYVDKLEELTNEALETTDSIGNDTRKEIDNRYTTLIDMKKFILEDMLVWFMDKDILDLKKLPLGSFKSMRIEQERDKYKALGTKYKEYIDVDLIMAYFNKEVQNE